MTTLDGKHVLITGAASGIGRALATVAARAGAVLVLIDVDGPALAMLAEDLDATAAVMDVSDPGAWAALHTPATGWDFVALNAGVTTARPDEPPTASALVGLPIDRYRRVVGVNVDGVYFGLQATLPGIDGDGCVVATASVAGVVGHRLDPIYSMSKHAVVGLIRSTAGQMQMAGRSVRVCAICPGATATPLLPDYAARVPAMDASAIAAEIIDLWTAGANGEIRVKVSADLPAQQVSEPQINGWG